MSSGEFDPKCVQCYGTGTYIMCGWCHFNEPHSFCDDTFTFVCECYKEDLKEDSDEKAD